MTLQRLAGVFLSVVAASLLSASFAYADGGTLYVSPDYGVYSIGDTFQVQVLADSGGQPINAAEADLTFNPEALEVEDVSTDGSILTSWPTEPHFSNADGTIGFSGVASTNFTGTGGLLVTITFKALRNMQSDARLAAGAILAADNLESNIITTMKSGVFTVQAQDETPNADGTYPSDATDTSDTSDPDSDNGTAVTTDANGDAIASADASNTDSTDSNASDIPAPVISGYQNEISTGDRIVISGTAPASSTVSIYLQQGSETPERTDLTSGDDGSFTYVSDTEVQTGNYEVWAITLGEGGDQSDESNKVEITASPSAAAASAVFVTTLISGLMPLFALGVFALLGAGYILHRHKIEKLKLAQQNKDA